MFYDDELRACADELLRTSFCRWDGLKTPGFPVIFEPVYGKDEREERSPSFFNTQEVSVVVRYVRELKEARGNAQVKMEDIGIISPYHKQVFNKYIFFQAMCITERFSFIGILHPSIHHT